MEQLEALTNAELRTMCIEHGLPNVPVTESSRKVLIRRLYATMNPNMKTKSTKSSNRRDTIAAAKPASPKAEKSKANKARHTIVGSSVATTYQQPNKSYDFRDQHTVDSVERSTDKTSNLTRYTNKNLDNSIRYNGNIETRANVATSPPAHYSNHASLARNHEQNNIADFVNPPILLSSTLRSPYASTATQSLYTDDATLILNNNKYQKNTREFGDATNILPSTAHTQSTLNTRINNNMNLPTNSTMPSGISTHRNDNMLLSPRKLTMTPPSVISHKPIYTFDNHLENDYKFDFQRQSPSKRTSLPLPELVNDTREVIETETSVEQDEQLTTFHAPKQRSLYSRAFDEPNIQGRSSYQTANIPNATYSSAQYKKQSESLYPRLDDLMPPDTSSIVDHNERRRSRSNSLTKSGVVTTSYTQEKANLPKLDEENSFSGNIVNNEPINYTRFTNSMHNRLYNSSRPSGGYTRSYSAEELDEDNSDVGISSDEDELPTQSYHSRNLKRHQISALDAPSEVTFSDIIEAMDRKYYIRQIGLMVFCMTLAIIIFKNFM